MSNNVFNKQMSSHEARQALFEAVEGKKKDEVEQIKSAYSKILPTILEREHRLASNGWVIG